ncbi:MAG: hypothetical protein IKC58_01785 [Clostridia bacterium]|nr:hypothetical protein [Clostridia bacterium]
MPAVQWYLNKWVNNEQKTFDTYIRNVWRIHYFCLTDGCMFIHRNFCSKSGTTNHYMFYLELPSDSVCFALPKLHQSNQKYARFHNKATKQNANDKHADTHIFLWAHCNVHASVVGMVADQFWQCNF